MKKAFRYNSVSPFWIKVALVFVLPISKYLTTALIKYPYIITAFIVVLLVAILEIAKQYLK